MTTTLYYSPGACSLAVHIVLEWSGQPYEAVRVDLHHPDPGFKRINPAGAVPALDHGGSEPLTQCAAILTYLALLHPELELLDDAGPERTAQVVKWTAFFTGDLHPAFWPVFMPKRYTVSTAAAAQADVREAGLALVRGKLSLLEQQLDGQTWIVAGKRTVVDAYAVPMLNWAVSMLPGGLAGYPAVQTFHQRMLADPGVRRAMEAEGLPVSPVETPA